MLKVSSPSTTAADKCYKGENLKTGPNTVLADLHSSSAVHVLLSITVNTGLSLEHIRYYW